MNRYILFIIIILIPVIYLQGRQLTESYYQEDISLNDSISDSWKEKLTDSCGIPSPAINLALNGFFTLKSKNLLSNDTLLSIIDFSKTSAEKR